MKRDAVTVGVMLFCMPLSRLSSTDSRRSGDEDIGGVTSSE
jgi:hypothetical protein